MSAISLILLGFLGGVLSMVVAQSAIAAWRRGPRERRHYLSPTGEHPYAVSRQRPTRPPAKSSDSYESATPSLTRLVDSQRSNPRGGNS